MTAPPAVHPGATPAEAPPLSPRLDTFGPVTLSHPPRLAKGSAPHDAVAAAGSRARVQYSGLTGLRAVAVALVVGYHVLPDAVPGGFLGVDVFFAISGYLITRLLLRGRATAPLSLRDFYVRRARRLLPALGAVLVFVTAAAVVWRDQLATIRSADLAALTYTSNWWLVFDHQSYFVASGRPPMLQHLWSLAIEEQFYLLWPLVLVFLTRRVAADATGRAATARLRRRVVLVAVAGAAGSALLMHWRAVATDVPYGSDGSRLYFGTDTHVTGLLLGAALGAWLQLRSPRPRWGNRRLRRLVAAPGWSDLAGASALAVLVGWGFTWTEYSPGLFRTGFASVAVACCVLLAAITRRGSALGRALDWRPLYWLGERSYGIYLWHWPVTVVTRPGLDVHASAGAVAVLRISMTLALAALSHRFIEQPIRRRGWRAVADGLTACRERLVLPAAAVAVGLAALLAFVTQPPATPSFAAALRAPGGTGQVLNRPAFRGPAGGSPTSPGVPAPGTGTTAGAQSPRPAAADTLPPPRPTPPPAASLYGDSVLLGAASSLRPVFKTVMVDAVEGRLPRPILQDAQADAAAHRTGRVVLLHVGNNGVISPDDLKTTLRALHAAARVVVLNDRVDRPWESVNNDLLARIVPRFHNARLVDWHAAAAGHESWFYGDGLHVTPDGAKHYAALVAAAAG